MFKIAHTHHSTTSCGIRKLLHICNVICCPKRINRSRLQNYKNGINNFSYKGTTHKNGYSCHLLEYENINYSYIDYTVQERETASSISSKLYVNDYLLRDKNDLLNDFGYLKKGSVLKVPNLYCKKAILFIDENTMLPISISLYDDSGLFESYDFSALQINKPFAENDFKRENKNYGF